MHLAVAQARRAHLRLHADRWVVEDVQQGAGWSAKARLSSRLAEAMHVLSTCR